MKHTTQATVTCAECGGRRTFVGTQWEVTVAAEVWRRRMGVPHTMVGQWRSGLTGREPARAQRDRAVGSDAGDNLGAHQPFQECRTAKRQLPQSRPRSAGNQHGSGRPPRRMGHSAASPGQTRCPLTQPSTPPLAKGS